MQKSEALSNKQMLHLIDALERKLEQLESSLVSNSQNSVGALLQTISEQEQQLIELQTENQEMNPKIDQLSNMNRQLNSENEKLSEENNRLVERIDILMNIKQNGNPTICEEFSESEISSLVESIKRDLWNDYMKQ